MGMPITDGAIEEYIATVRQEWHRLLEIDGSDLADDSDFFSYGGHSMLAIELAARLSNSTGLVISAYELLVDTTVAGMAGVVWRAALARPEGAAVPVPVVEDAGTTAARILTTANQVARLAALKGPDRWQQPPCVFGIRLRGVVSRDILADSLTWIVRRHSALRSYFPGTETVFAVCVPVENVSWSLPVVDGAAELPALRGLERSFEVERFPLFRAVLIQHTVDEQLLGIAVDHLVFDGESVNVFLRELERVYAHLSAGADPSVLATTVSDFGLWADTERARALSPSAGSDEAYWAKRWAGLAAYPPLPLPMITQARQAEGPGRRWRRELSADDVARLRARAESHGITPFMLAATAVFVALRTAPGPKTSA
jgi:aryl carrier-like protein